MMRLCIHCGQRIDADANFCIYCGADPNNVIVAAKSQKTDGSTLMSILFILMCIPFLPFLSIAFMLFDAPGSEKSLFTNLLFYSIITFPATCLIAINCSASANKYVRYAPLFNVLAFSIACVGIKFLQGGSFVPR